MPQRDPARDIMDALAGWFAGAGPDATATLDVDDDFQPAEGELVLLVADDGGPRVHNGAWMTRKSMHRITIRLTAFARGRTAARELVVSSADWIYDNKPAGITRIEDVSAPLETKDRATGARLASITVPVIVRPITT